MLSSFLIFTQEKTLIINCENEDVIALISHFKSRLNIEMPLSDMIFEKYSSTLILFDGEKSDIFIKGKNIIINLSLIDSERFSGQLQGLLEAKLPSHAYLDINNSLDIQLLASTESYFN